MTICYIAVIVGAITVPTLYIVIALRRYRRLCRQLERQRQRMLRLDNPEQREQPL